jgi:hypothetical protein
VRMMLDASGGYVSLHRKLLDPYVRHVLLDCASTSCTIIVDLTVTL